MHRGPRIVCLRERRNIFVVLLSHSFSPVIGPFKINFDIAARTHQNMKNFLENLFLKRGIPVHSLNSVCTLIHPNELFRMVGFLMKAKTFVLNYLETVCNLQRTRNLEV